MLEKFVKTYFASEKRILGISITQEGMLECVFFNPQTKVVENYARREINFNQVKKMVEDMGDLSKALEEMITELGVKPKTSVVVNLPNFYFGFMDVDAYTQSEEEIKSNIVAEVEQSYMFRQNKPLIDYYKTKYGWTQKAKAAFCAAQADVVGSIKNMLIDLELIPVAFENSYSSLFKSLQYFGFLNEQLTSGSSWGVVFVNQNSYTVFSLVGDNLVDVTEDAVAIKTYEKNEVNDSVASVINSSLQEMSFKSVILVNNSAECSAEELGNFLGEYQPNITVIENNGTKQCLNFKSGTKVVLSDEDKITLFALGAALYEYENMEFLLKFDLGREIKGDEEIDEGFQIAGVPIELNDTNCLKLLFLILLPFFIVFGLIYLGVTGLNNSLSEQAQSLNQEAAKLEKAKEQFVVTEEKVTFDPWEEINNVMEANDYNQKCYESLSVNIPKSIWLTYFYNNTYKATIIRGNTKASGDIYKFFRDLKKRMEDKNLVLSKISVSEFDPSTYEFEITNKKYMDLLDLIKNLDENREYRDLLKKQEDDKAEKYKNSLFPIYPSSDFSIKSPFLDEESAISEEYVESLKELGNTPKTLPPT